MPRARSTAPHSTNDENIFLFVPNLIGYGRVVAGLASFYFMLVDGPDRNYYTKLAALLYLASGLFDAVDGMAARHFKQSTRFGAVLDMVTDRCATTCLMVTLGALFAAQPLVAFGMQLLIALDLSSHWLAMTATLLDPNPNRSHKEIDETQNALLRLYYTDKRVLFVVCAMNELFFCMLYLSGRQLEVAAGLGGAACASAGAIMPPGTPAGQCGAVELVWLASLPFFAFKQLTNVIQLVGASKAIATIDRRERAKAKN